MDRTLRADISRSTSDYDPNQKRETKKILLVNPPSGFLLDERVFLPLGIANIAAVARSRGHAVTLMDLAGSSDYAEKVTQAVLAENYDAVGITATSPQFYYADKILEKVKKSKPSQRVIIGGPHASMFASLRKSLIQRFSSKGITGADLEYKLHEEDVNFKSLERFDVIANGEENSLDIALVSNEKWVEGGITVNLDALPFPARDLFDVQSYLFDSQGTPKFKIDGKASGSIISQRGCPYQCEFCCGRDSAQLNRVRIGGKLRTHSPERILSELDMMHREFGISSFMFYDDEFNLHPASTKELCNALKKRTYSLRGFVKSDLLVQNPEIAQAMREAGFAEVLSGIESGSDRILGRHLHKRTTPELNHRATMICLENKIGFKALTMLGHTSETEEDIQATKAWILKTGREFKDKLGPGYFTFDLTVFQPYAGCPIWDRAQRNGGDFADEYAWKYETVHKGEVLDPEFGGLLFNKVDFATHHGFYKGIPGEYKAFIRTKKVSAERFVQLRDEIEYEIRDKLEMPQLRKPTAQSQLEHSMAQGATQSK